MGGRLGVTLGDSEKLGDNERSGVLHGERGRSTHTAAGSSATQMDGSECSAAGALNAGAAPPCTAAASLTGEKQRELLLALWRDARGVPRGDAGAWSRVRRAGVWRGRAAVRRGVCGSARHRRVLLLGER